MSGVNISPSYIDIMKIGDGATGTITRSGKEGGIVAIVSVPAFWLRCRAWR